MPRLKRFLICVRCGAPLKPQERSADRVYYDWCDRCLKRTPADRR